MIDLATRVEDCCGVDLASLPDATRDLLAERLRGLDAAATRQAILELVSVPETMFWRHAGQLESLRAALPHELAAWSSPCSLRVWSAGCASGEEAYSLAALLRELGRPASVLGTDINPRALERARAGRYRPWSLRRVPSEWTARWLSVRGREISVDPSLREGVRFEGLDLSRDPYPPAQDLIVCRNVLIYFSPRMLARTFERFAEALAPGGLLLLAPTDPTPPDGWTQASDLLGLYRHGESQRSSSAARPSPQPVTSPPLAPAEAPLDLPPTEPEPDPPDVVWGLAGQGDYEAALRTLDAALAANPLQVGLWTQRAMIAEEAGLIDEATTAARRACLLAPNAAAPNFWLACCLKAVGEGALAENRLKLVERTLREFGDDDPVPYTGGLCSADLRRLISALREQP